MLEIKSSGLDKDLSSLRIILLRRIEIPEKEEILKKAMIVNATHPEGIIPKKIRKNRKKERKLPR